MKSRFMYLILAAVVVVWAAAPACADLTQKDSGEFGFKYDMDVDPTNVSLIDLDSNSTRDWAATGVGTPTYSGGIATFASEPYEGGENYSALHANGIESGNIWPNAGITKTTGYTFEFRAKVISQTEGKVLAGYLEEYQNPGGVNGGWLGLRTAGQQWGLSGDSNFNYADLGSQDNTDVYHTFRYAREEDSDNFWVWRDNVLLNPGGTALPSALNYATVTTPRLALTDWGGTAGGTILVDYLRFTAGAYAPIPEPSTLALLATGLLGLLAYAWRKRR